jgi:hypothetical protein
VAGYRSDPVSYADLEILKTARRKKKKTPPRKINVE